MKKFTVDDCYNIQNNPLMASKILDYIPLQEDEYLHLIYNINFNIIDKSFGYDNGLSGFNIVSNGVEITRLNNSEEYRVVATDNGLKLLIVRVHGSVNGVNHYCNIDLVGMYSIFIIEKEITLTSGDYYEYEVVSDDPSSITRVTYGIRDIRRAENVRDNRVKKLRELLNLTPTEKYILKTITTREYRLPRTVIIVDKMDYKSILIAAVLNMTHAKNSSYKEKVYIVSTDEVMGSEDEQFKIYSTDIIVSTTASNVGQFIEVHDIDAAISFVNQLQISLYTVVSLDSDRVKTICSNILAKYLVKDNITRDTVAIDVISHLTGSYKDTLEVFTKMIEVNGRNEDEMCIDIDGILLGCEKDSLNTIVDGVIKTINAFKNDNSDNNIVESSIAPNGPVNFKIFKTYLPFTVLRMLLISIKRLNLFKDKNYILYNYTTTDTDYGCIYSSIVTWLTPETAETVKSSVGVENLYTYLDKHLNGMLKGVPTTDMKRRIDGDMEVLTTDRLYKLSDVLNNDTGRLVGREVYDALSETMNFSMGRRYSDTFDDNGQIVLL